MAKYAEYLLGGLEREGAAGIVNPELERARFEHEQKIKQMELEYMERMEREKRVAEEQMEKERLAIENEKVAIE